MTLHLLRLDPDAHAVARWLSAEGLSPRDGEDDGYGWHALLSAVFGKELAPKPFRTLLRRGRPPQVLAYTSETPDALLEAAQAFADPLALAALGLANAPLAAKPMPALSAGRRLGLTVRLRPTIRTDRNGDRTKSAEIDAYVAALRLAEAEGKPRPDRETVYLEWATQHLEACGLNLVDLSLDGLERVPVARRGHDRRLGLVQGHAVEVKGVLEVTDAPAFAEALKRGVGRHRAFGYGMLLLSPA